MRLTTSGDTLTFDAGSGRLVSLQRAGAPGVEFLASAPEHPAFVIQYLDGAGAYRQLDSRAAETTTVVLEDGVLTAQFGRLGGQAVDVRFTVRTDGRFSRWNLTVDNAAGLRIVDVQFPFVVASYDLPGDRAVLRPLIMGELIANPQPQDLPPDFPRTWQFTPENGDSLHYPGGTFAQFIAYSSAAGGVYLACDDTQAHVKLIKGVHRDPGIRLGIAHVGDWPAGSRTLEYDVLLGSFDGDWYDAAELYRAWTLQQAWATPLHRRTDVPAWLLDSPPYITVRPQGVLDAGPVTLLEEFLPYEKILPLLDRLSRRVAAPLVCVLMGWERGGSWVYPDCFPPVGGDASLTDFCREARQRGWHVGSFCNGTRWVVAHAWNGYDGEPYFTEHHGERGVCRLPDGSWWPELWDRTWRPSYPTCLGEADTRRIATEFVHRLLGWGMESIQFFDQNCGAATFACFSDRHEHPPVPGRWMAEAMRRIIDAFHAEADALGERAVIHSTEQPANETCLPLFQQCDVRCFPPGYPGWNQVPLFQYLYHECIIMQGTMSMGPEPYHQVTANACNFVQGEIPGAVMTGDGTLLNRDTGNWAPWEPKVGNDDHAVEMIRTATAPRRSADFLVYGRMQRPAPVAGIPVITWEWNSHVYRVPAVFHEAYTAPDGRFGVALANWTDRPRRVTLHDARLGARAVVHTAGPKTARKAIDGDSPLTVTVPAHGCVLVAGDEA